MSKEWNESQSNSQIRITLSCTKFMVCTHVYVAPIVKRCILLLAWMAKISPSKRTCFLNLFAADAPNPNSAHLICDCHFMSWPAKKPHVRTSNSSIILHFVSSCPAYSTCYSLCWKHARVVDIFRFKYLHVEICIFFKVYLEFHSPGRLSLACRSPPRSHA